MAIDSKTIHEGSQPIGIPAGRHGVSGYEAFGSSPPVRLPNFASPNHTGRSSNAPRDSASGSVLGSGSSSSSSSSGSRRRRRNVLSTSSVRQNGLEVHRSMSIEQPYPDEYDPLQALSTSFFSTISIDDIFSDMDEDDDGAELEGLCAHLDAGLPGMEGAEQCFARIAKQGRRLLRSSRLPIEHVLEFESLVFERLQSKTPRHRFLQDEEHFLALTIQNPYRRSLLHSVCQYYRLNSQTVDKAAGLTIIRATQQSISIPQQRLSEYLAVAFGHALP